MISCSPAYFRARPARCCALATRLHDSVAMCRGLVGPPGCRGHAPPDEWEIHRESGGHRPGLRPHGTERIPDPAGRGANGTIDAAPQVLAATIGADGRRLLQAVETATDVPWLRCWVRPILRRIGRISHPFVSVSARLWQTLRFGQCCVVPVYQTGPRPTLLVKSEPAEKQSYIQRLKGSEIEPVLLGVTCSHDVAYWARRLTKPEPRPTLLLSHSLTEYGRVK